MPFYQEDKRHASDARYGLTATTRGGGMWGSRRRRVSPDDEMSHEDILHAVDEIAGPDTPENVKALFYQQMMDEYGPSDRGRRRGRGGKYADEREGRAEQRFKEHEEDREEKKAAAKERREEAAAKREQATLSRLQSQVERYEERMDRLNKELGTGLITDDRKASIKTRMAQLTQEHEAAEDELDALHKDIKKRRIMAQEGMDENTLVENFMKKGREAKTPEDLEIWQNKAKSLGLDINLQAERRANPFLADNPQVAQQALGYLGQAGKVNPPTPYNFEQSPSPLMQALQLPGQGGSPQAGQPPQGQGEAPGFTDEDLASFREDAGLIPKKPWLTREDIGEVGGNLSSIGHNIGESARGVWKDPSSFMSSGLYGDFGKEMRENRAKDRAFVNAIDERDKDINWFLRGWDRPLEAAQAVGARADLLTGGMLKSYMDRIGKEVRDTTGSKTAGNVAELIAPLPGVGAMGKVNRMLHEMRPGFAPKPGEFAGAGMPSPPHLGGAGGPPAGSFPPPAVIPPTRLKPLGPDVGPYGPYQPGMGPNRPSPMQSGVPQIERYREPYAYNPPRGGFRGFGEKPTRGRPRPQFPDPFAPMAGPIPAGTPNAARMHPSYAKEGPGPFDMRAPPPQGLLPPPQASRQYFKPELDALETSLRRGEQPLKGKTTKQQGVRRQQAYKTDKVNREGQKKSTTDKRSKKKDE